MRQDSSVILGWTRSTGTPRCRRASSSRRPLGCCPPLGTSSPRASLTATLFSVPSLVASSGDSLLAAESTGTNLLRWELAHVLTFYSYTTFSAVIQVSSSLSLLVSSSDFFSNYFSNDREPLKLLKSSHDHAMNLRRFGTTVESKTFALSQEFPSLFFDSRFFRRSSNSFGLNFTFSLFIIF